jgi:hypothetical protein
MTVYEEKEKNGKGENRDGSIRSSRGRLYKTTQFRPFVIGGEYPTQEDYQHEESTAGSSTSGTKRRKSQDDAEKKAKFTKISLTDGPKESETSSQGESQRKAKLYTVPQLRAISESTDRPATEQLEEAGESSKVACACGGKGQNGSGQVTRSAIRFNVGYGSGPKLPRAKVSIKRLRMVYTNPILLALRQSTNATAAEPLQEFYTVIHNRIKVEEDGLCHSRRCNFGDSGPEDNNPDGPSGERDEEPPDVVYFLSNYPNLHDANLHALVESYECYPDLAATICHESCVCPKASWATTRGVAEWLKDSDGCLHLRADYENPAFTAIIYVQKQKMNVRARGCCNLGGELAADEALL